MVGELFGESLGVVMSLTISGEAMGEGVCIVLICSGVATLGVIMIGEEFRGEFGFRRGEMAVL